MLCADICLVLQLWRHRLQSSTTLHQTFDSALDSPGLLLSRSGPLLLGYPSHNVGEHNFLYHLLLHTNLPLLSPEQNLDSWWTGTMLEN